MLSATRITASTFGALAGLGGIRHGIGEVQQGNVRPDGLFIESWTEGPIADHMDGEPGITIVPNMLATGILALAVSSVVVLWALFFVRRRRGGLILTLLSVAMLLVGGGVGPPVIGMLAGWPGAVTGSSLDAWRGRLRGRTRDFLAAAWPWLYALAATNGVFLFLISVVLLFAFDFQRSDPVLYSFYLAVALLILTTISAIACDLRHLEGVPVRMKGTAL
ncbi:MAG: hypothetical protein AB7L91_10115 [Dehalococcoidia bacterium]